MKRTRRHSGPITDNGYHATRAASVTPSTYRDSDNTVEVIWSTGSSVRRGGSFGGSWIETLDMQPGSIRLARLNDGGPLLDSHDMYAAASLLGSIVPGSVRIEGGSGTARVTLTDAPDAADTITKLREGHLTGISVGYQVHTWELRDTDDPNEDEYVAVDWEPLEISLVTVPADPGAHVRSKDMTRIIDKRRRARGAGGSNQPPEIRHRAGPTQGSVNNGEPDEENEGEAERRQPARRAGFVSLERIRDVCGRSDDLPRRFERDLIAEHEETPLTDRELQRRVADELIAIRQLPSVNVRGGDMGRGGRGDDGAMCRNFADALFARLTGGEAPEAAREYRHAGLVDFARAILEARGERVRWMRNAQVIDHLCRAGAHTSSDFAGIISNAGRRYLVETFTQTPSPLKLLARKRDFPDFKRRYGVRANGPAVLRNVPEMGEFQRVGVQSSANGAQLFTYGEIFAISRQALINDDLSVFSDMAKFWATALSETEAALLVGMIQGTGVVMEEDNKPLYDAAHGNIATTPAALSVTSLSAARQQMRTAKNRDGLTVANVIPKYLTVGAALETEAEQVLAALNAGKIEDVNPFSGKMELVVDPRLTGRSWRLFADPALSPVLEYGNLEGEDGLFTDARVGFDVDGVEFKARTDLGAGAVDYRGTLLNQGG